MGAKFTNLQVFVGSKSSAEAQAEIIEAIRQFISSSGKFEEILDEQQFEDADRKIIIAPPFEDEPWISVYDEAGYDTLLTDQAKAISSALNTSVVSVQVFDSDVVNLNLLDKGELLDQYCNDPDYGRARRVSTKKRAELAGKPQLWSELFADRSNIPATVEKLAGIWKETPVFAEDIVYNTAPLLGMANPRVGTGYYYSTREGLEPGFVVLSFRATQVPDFMREAEGLPVFSAGGGITQALLTEGITNRDTFGSASVTNQGGASRGLRLVVWGSALDQRLLEINTIQVVTRSTDSDQPIWSDYQLEAVEDSEGRTIRQLILPDFEIPSGTVSQGINLEAGFSPHRVVAAWFATQVHINLHGGGLKAGQGELYIGFQPLANPGNGQASWRIQVEVYPKPRRIPLRYTGASDLHIIRELRSLELSDKLSALVVLGTHREIGADLAGAAFEAWKEILGSQGAEKYQIVLNEDVSKRVKQYKLGTNQIPRSKKWQDLRVGLGDYVSLQGYLISPEGDTPTNLGQGTGGFSFDANSFFGVYRTEQPVLHLGFWKDLSGLSNEEVELTTVHLVTLVDNLMKQGNGLQALIARWDWYPGHFRVITPYEYAYGDHWFVAGDRKWCSRFLRGVTEELWLGSELFENLGGEKIISSLETVTELRSLGESLEQGVHLSLKEGASLEELEQVLAPILANKNDVQIALEQNIEWKRTQSTLELPEV